MVRFSGTNPVLYGNSQVNFGKHEDGTGINGQYPYIGGRRMQISDLTIGFVLP